MKKKTREILERAMNLTQINPNYNPTLGDAVNNIKKAIETIEKKK